MATGSPSPQNPTVPLRYRPSVSDLQPDDVAKLRAAFDAVQQLDDDRGYQYFAGLHGLPLPAWCDRFGHGKPWFLHWHRAYLYRFERALQVALKDDSVMVPWWDWRYVREVPSIYAEEAPEGTANPLFSVHINDRAIEEGLRGSGDDASVILAGTPDTFRDPGSTGFELPTKKQIDTILDYDFKSFNGQLETYHGDVHMWVGGHMTDVPYAAYDPIFWAHHAMVDRVWRMWQKRNSAAASLPAPLMDTVMQPFHLDAKETLDPTVLGYDYALTSTDIPVN